MRDNLVPKGGRTRQSTRKKRNSERLLAFVFTNPPSSVAQFPPRHVPLVSTMIFDTVGNHWILWYLWSPGFNWKVALQSPPWRNQLHLHPVAARGALPFAVTWTGFNCVNNKTQINARIIFGAVSCYWTPGVRHKPRPHQICPLPTHLTAENANARRPPLGSRRNNTGAWRRLQSQHTERKGKCL